MDTWDFIQTWLALEAGAYIGKERLRLFYAEAAKRGVNVATQRLSGMQMYPETPMQEIWETGKARQPQRSLARRIAGGALRRAPYVAAGGAIGYSLRELEMEDAYDAIDTVDRSVRSITGMPASMSRAPRVKKKLSKFNKAVSAGMKALKRSKNYGKPGTINNGKKAFKQVTKVASRINKGAKVASKGVTGVIKRGIGRILK